MPSVKGNPIPKDEKLFVKAFLIDDSLNINKWRVSRDSIPKNINSFIGKPLILYQNERGFDHPDPFYGRAETLNHLLSYQESYRVGTIIDVTSKENPSMPGTKSYHAIIEVTHPDLKNAIRNNNIPVYVSPGIGELVVPTATANAKTNAISATKAAIKTRQAFSSWEHCHDTMMKEYGDKDIADRVCGSLKAIGQASLQQSKIAADYPWDQCIADQMKKYGDKNTAEKVCGSIKAQYGGTVTASIATPEDLAGGDLVDEWTGMHLAIVDDPAYGIKKAVISHTCGGDKEGCLLQLRNAHVDRYGAGNCGFCVTKAMQKYKIIQEYALTKPKIAANANVTLQNTSHTKTKTANQVLMSQIEQTSEPAATTTNSPRETVEVVERSNTITNPVPTTRAPVQANTTYTIPELTQANAQLKQENELLKLKIEELNNANGTITDRLAAIEMERRREKIERIITPDVIKDDKQRLEKIKFFTSSTIPIEHLEELYKDVRITLRKASTGQRPYGRVPYGINQSGSGGIASPVAPTSGATVAVDEETGMTPLQKQLAVLRGGP